MKLHILSWAVALQFAFLPLGTSQTVRSVERKIDALQFSNYENKDASLGHLNFFEAMAEPMQFSPGTEMVLQTTIGGFNGFAHFKYQQYFNELPIVGGTYVLHEKNGVVERATGYFYPSVRTETQPKMNANTAQSFAKQYLKAERFAEEQPQPILCIVDPDFPLNAGSLRLAYQVDLTTLEPFDKRRLYVDALTGKILNQLPLILKEGVPSKAQTRYYGIQNIITDSLGPNNFHLHDPTRGNGITVYSPSLEIFTNNSSEWDLTNANQDEVALDAHYCSQVYYDMMLESFGWKGLDGNGKELKVMVHNNGAGDVNAFWDGEFTNYGDGNCNYGPLTTLEVVGHEFTHGFTEFTSKLVYSGESGAINESMSDMFGKLLERKTDPDNFNWDLGHSFLLSPEAKPFRVMDDPASVGMPDFYKGELWEDFSGVHTNSAVGNLWFTMIVDGRQGTNEIGESYNVPAIGIEKAGQIAFLTNSAYLTESSNYDNLYEYSMLAAAELYGVGSTEQLAVQEAWKAVGLPAAAPQSLDLGLSATYELTNHCGFDQFYPIVFQVVNPGGQAYMPSMGATVTLDGFSAMLPNHTIMLDQAIAPGESITITVDDWFIPSEAGTFFVNIELDFMDENSANNYSWNAFQIVAHQASDFSLTTYHETPTCFSKEVKTSFFINNESCETMPAGTPVMLKAFSSFGPTLLWSMPYTLQNDLVGFGVEVVEAVVDLSGLEPFASVIFRVEGNGDPNPDNDEEEQGSPFSQGIDGDYLNVFIDASDDSFLDIETIFSDPIVVYQSDNFFASTGYFSDPGAFVHCPDYESSFDSYFYGGINTTMRACIDFSAFQNPLLEFDLALLRNDSAVVENYLHSSMMQVKWTGTQDGSDIIFDQPEGDVVHHSYQLPENFKGELLLKLFTEAGSWEIDPANFEIHDFVLMDNLRLSTVSSGIEDEQQIRSVEISPNPASNVVRVKSRQPLGEIFICDISGQSVRQVHAGASDMSLDVSSLAPGFYTIKIQLANGQWLSEKLVKI